jgi:hypothetical protein
VRRRGLEEIKSREALEALIVSLKPTAEKERLTKDCLKRLYYTDKFPPDPNSPEALCSPDGYTHGFLRVLTGIGERHEYGWWKSWWDANRNRLAWSSEKGKFELEK